MFLANKSPGFTACFALTLFLAGCGKNFLRGGGDDAHVSNDSSEKNQSTPTASNTSNVQSALSEQEQLSLLAGKFDHFDHNKLPNIRCTIECDATSTAVDGEADANNPFGDSRAFHPNKHRTLLPNLGENDKAKHLKLLYTLAASRCVESAASGFLKLIKDDAAYKSCYVQPTSKIEASKMRAKIWIDEKAKINRKVLGIFLVSDTGNLEGVTMQELSHLFSY